MEIAHVAVILMITEQCTNILECAASTPHYGASSDIATELRPV